MPREYDRPNASGIAAEKKSSLLKPERSWPGRRYFADFRRLLSGEMTERGASRRKFLRDAAVVAGAVLLGTEAGAVSAQGSMTEREQSNFVFPEDLRGNEPFWGQDVLITIDDCVLIEQTRQMFEQLKSFGARATFFPNTRNIPLDNPEIVALWRDIYQSGFEIGYHTTNHVSEGVSQAEFEADFDQFSQKMQEVLGDQDFSIKFARPPYGAWTEQWMGFIRAKNLSNVRWNYVPDAESGGMEYFAATTRHPRGGRIILLHPRVWDEAWLGSHLSQLQTFAESEGGRITTLSGNPES